VLVAVPDNPVGPVTPVAPVAPIGPGTGTNTFLRLRLCS
jgi:hypothetical protein